MSETTGGPIRVSAVIQVDPVWRPGKPGEPFAGDLDTFAEGMTRFLADGLSRFAEERGADLFVTLIAERDGDERGREFRTGQYVKFPNLPGPLPAQLDNPL